MNMLIDALPEAVSVDGVVYPVRWQFRTFLLIEELMEDPELSDEMKLGLALNLFFDNNVPPNTAQATKRLTEFYMGGSSPDEPDSSQKDAKSRARALHYGHDRERIFTAFWRSYGINLTRADNLHWYEFKAMFSDLDADCLLVKIIGYRTMNIAKIKDKEQRKFYADMKRKYALPLSKKAKEELKRIELALLGDGDLTKR